MCFYHSFVGYLGDGGYNASYSRSIMRLGLFSTVNG